MRPSARLLLVNARHWRRLSTSTSTTTISKRHWRNCGLSLTATHLLESPVESRRGWSVGIPQRRVWGLSAVVRDCRSVKGSSSYQDYRRHFCDTTNDRREVRSGKTKPTDGSKVEISLTKDTAHENGTNVFRMPAHPTTFAHITTSSSSFYSSREKGSSESEPNVVNCDTSDSSVSFLSSNDLVQNCDKNDVQPGFKYGHDAFLLGNDSTSPPLASEKNGTSPISPSSQATLILPGNEKAENKRDVSSTNDPSEAVATKEGHDFTADFYEQYVRSLTNQSGGDGSANLSLEVDNVNNNAESSTPDASESNDSANSTLPTATDSKIQSSLKTFQTKIKLASDQIKTKYDTEYDQFISNFGAKWQSFVGRDKAEGPRRAMEEEGGEVQDDKEARLKSSSSSRTRKRSTSARSTASSSSSSDAQSVENRLDSLIADYTRYQKLLGGQIKEIWASSRPSTKSPSTDSSDSSSSSTSTTAQLNSLNKLLNIQSSALETFSKLQDQIR